MTAEIEGQRKAAPNVVKAVDQALGDLGEQEIVARQCRGGTIAAQSQLSTVEDRHGIGHHGYMARRFAETKAAVCGGRGLTGVRPARFDGLMVVGGLHLHALRRVARTLFDVLLPPQCLACGAAVADAGSLCGACWQGTDFIGPPYCQICGLPFPFDHGSEAICGGCARRPPPFARARAVMRYGDVSRALILNFKHGDQTHGAPAFGRWLARAGEPLLADADVVAPVPLHRWRLAHRRYNQAALLAAAIGRVGAKPMWPELLVRRRRTRSQGGLSALGRSRNVRGAFAVRERDRQRLQGRRVLLIDDVYTTGATLREGARVLHRAGAGAVDVLTLARVVRPDDGGTR